VTTPAEQPWPAALRLGVLSNPRVALGFLLAVWLLMALGQSWLKSPSHDELPHLAAGLVILEFGDFRINPEHPPLIKVLAALPVWLFACPPLGPEPLWLAGLDTNLFPLFRSDQVPYATFIFYLVESGIPQVEFFLGRLAPTLIGLLGGCLAAVWAQRLSGSPRAGIIAAGLLLFYPEYLGHAPLVTLDVPQLVAMAAISDAAWRWWHRPGWASAALWLLAAVIASLIKLPLWIALAVTGAVLAFLVAPGWRLRTLALGAATVLLVFAAQWAAAGFRFQHQSNRLALERPGPYILSERPRPGASLSERVAQQLWNHRLLPETTLATIVHASRFGKEYHLRGEWSRTGWWSYFAWTTLLKTPPGLLLVLLVFVPYAVRQLVFEIQGGARDRLAQLLLLTTAPIVLLAIIVLSRHNLGHRYILFIYFPLCVLAGVGLCRWIGTSPRRTIAGIPILVAALLPAVISWPNGATYINQLGGGSPWAARTVFQDSNVDWGQDAWLLMAWHQRNGTPAMNLAVTGHFQPQNHGITQWRWIHPAQKVFAQERLDSPDSSLPTAVSINAVVEVQRQWPGLIDREPDVLLNSIAVWLPRQ
jgi:hypothetical protein